MLQYTKAKGVSAGAGEPITRDCPNIIIPTLANAIGPVPGTNWAWGANLAITSPSTYELLLIQMIVGAFLGNIYSANGTNQFSYMIQFQLRKYVNQAYTILAHSQMTESGVATIGGIVDDEVSASLFVTSCRGIKCGPIRISASTPLRLRATISGVPTSIATRLYLSGYDTNTFSLIRVPYIDRLYESGSKAAYPALLPLDSAIALASHAVTTWTYGSWVTVNASLDADYLIREAYAIPGDTKTCFGDQIELGLGAVDSEVIQARYAMTPLAFFNSSVHTELRYPFIAYKGERLAARVASSTQNRAVMVGVYGVRLS